MRSGKPLAFKAAIRRPVSRPEASTKLPRGFQVELVAQPWPLLTQASVVEAILILLVLFAHPDVRHISAPVPEAYKRSRVLVDIAEFVKNASSMVKFPFPDPPASPLK